MKFLVILLLITLINCFNNKINALQLVEIKFNNPNCEGDPQIIRFANKYSKNGKVEIIGKNNQTGNIIIAQKFDNNKTYENEMNVCIPEGDISFYFILHKKTNRPLSIPTVEDNSYCNQIDLLNFDSNQLETQCKKHALINTYQNGTCLLKGNNYYQYICDPIDKTVKRFICKSNCQQDDSSCKLDDTLKSPKSICPHFKEKPLKKLLKKK
ncbi:hypothetical protein RB653_010471 [Dictyostelium firmibasis]|uniref:Uncharacterized protein n=1 Tax=Dictyostelium firmibasis TaxID=79012 RepID=A0AAN7TT50_9MYCE